MNEYAAEFERINGNVASTYAALSEMGATMPEQQNSNNLPGTARTVPQGGGSGGTVAWENVTGKPFHIDSSDTLIVPSMTEEEILALMNSGSLVGGYYLKISDAVFTMSDFENGFTIFVGNETIEVPNDEVVNYVFEEADGLIIVFYALISVDEQFVGVDIDGFSFPEKGLYFAVTELISEFRITIPGYDFVGTEKINNEAVPNATNFYINSEDSYLYKSMVIAEDNRVTMSELKKAYYGGLKLILTLVVGGMKFYDYYPEGMGVGNNTLYCYTRDSRDSLVTTKFFTAEYVPESTT